MIVFVTFCLTSISAHVIRIVITVNPVPQLYYKQLQGDRHEFNGVTRRTISAPYP